MITEICLSSDLGAQFFDNREAITMFIDLMLGNKSPLAYLKAKHHQNIQIRSMGTSSTNESIIALVMNLVERKMK